MERFEIYQRYVEQSKGEPLNTKEEMGNEKFITGETLDLNEIERSLHQGKRCHRHKVGISDITKEESTT